MKGLTERQSEILEWIRAFLLEHGIPPTVREIGREFGIAPSSVFGHLKALQRKGYVRRGDMGARSLEVACMSGRDRAGDSIRLPLVGRIAAGTPLLAVENLEGWVAVGRDLVRPDGSQYYALRVKGDSMKDAGILEGDCVIVRKQETAEDGDIIVALLDNEEVTLKFFYLERKKRRIRLQPANPKWKPIHTRNVMIQGVVKGLVRALN